MSQNKEGLVHARSVTDRPVVGAPSVAGKPVCPQCGLVGIERIPPTQCKYPACGPGCLYEIGRKP